MKKKIFDIFLILAIFGILIEISSIALIKLSLLPNGLTPRITLIQNKDFAYWHHKNESFKLASKCWSSKISYNNYGMRQIRNINLTKDEPRIGILGDSMTENLEVSDGKDFANLLQKKLPNYEILNFSVRSLGLGDQIELYDKFAKRFKLDYIFLFISDNDFEDNYLLNPDRPTQVIYKIINGSIKKERIRNSNTIKKNNKFSNIKKNLILLIKQNLNTYLLYFHSKNYLNFHLKKNQKKNTQINLQFNNTKEKELVYKFMVDKFYKKLSNNEKVYIFVNPRPKIIQKENSPEKENIKMMSFIWGYDKVLDPTNAGINYLQKINKNSYPYFSFDCDGHYSELGAKFMSEYVSNYFLNN